MALKLDKKTKDLCLTLDSVVRKEIEREMLVTSEIFELSGSTFIDNIRQEMLSRQGMAPAEIAGVLTSQKNNLMGAFGDLKKSINQQAEKMTYDTQQSVFFDGIKEDFADRQLFMWQAMFVRTCPSCIDLHGTTRTLAVWDRTGIPKEADTICGKWCNCLLIPMEVMPSREDERLAIQIESKRIRKAEKKRGKRYSSSYRSAIVGNINNPDFKDPSRNLSKIKKIK